MLTKRSVSRAELLDVGPRKADVTGAVPFKQRGMVAEAKAMHHRAEERRVCRRDKRRRLPVGVDRILCIDVLDVIGVKPEPAEAEDVLQKRPGVTGTAQRMLAQSRRRS